MWLGLDDYSPHLDQSFGLQGLTFSSSLAPWAKFPCFPSPAQTLGQSSSTYWSARVWWPHTLALGSWTKSTKVPRRQLFMARENLRPGAARNPQVFFHSSWCETWIFWRQTLSILGPTTYNEWWIPSHRPGMTDPCLKSCLVIPTAHASSAPLTNQTKAEWLCFTWGFTAKQKMDIHSWHNAWRIPSPSSQQQTVISNIHTFFLFTQRSA